MVSTRLLFSEVLSCNPALWKLYSSSFRNTGRVILPSAFLAVKVLDFTARTGDAWMLASTVLNFASSTFLTLYECQLRSFDGLCRCHSTASGWAETYSICIRIHTTLWSWASAGEGNFKIVTSSALPQESTQKCVLVPSALALNAPKFRLKRQECAKYYIFCRRCVKNRRFCGLYRMPLIWKWWRHICSSPSKIPKDLCCAFCARLKCA